MARPISNMPRVGTLLPRTRVTARPQLAKADTAFQAHPLVNLLSA